MSLSDAVRRATKLAENDFKLVQDLIQLRIDKGLSQADVAEALGISQQAVSRFERMDADPRLSTIRQYAHAIEALVWHAVESDEGQLNQAGRWTTMAFCVNETSEAPSSYQVATKPQSAFAIAA